MINEYIFDYRLVLEEEPSFEKFLNIGNIGIKESSIERLEYRNPIEEPITKLINDDESENEIIGFVHNKESDYKQNMDPMLTNANSNSWVKAREEEFSKKVELKQEYIDIPNHNYNPSILQLLPPNRFLLPGSKVWQGEYTLYNFTNSHIFDINNFICWINKYRFSQRDHFIRLQHAVYRFDRKQDIISELKKHLIMWTYNTKTKQLYKIKKVKKNELKKRSHFRNSVRKALYTLSNAGWHDVPTHISNKFISAVLEAAKKDIPNLVVLSKENPKPNSPKTKETNRIIIEHKYIEEAQNRRYRSIKLASIILQHRIGQPIKWLNYTLIQNIWDILGNLQFQETIVCGVYDNSKSREEIKLKAKALRRKTVYQLVPNLRKSNHMRTAIKTIIGENYSKFLIRLFNIDPINNTFLVEWIFAMNKGLISKNLYHWVAQTINNTNSSSRVIINMVENVSKILALVLRNYNIIDVYNDGFNWDQFSVILDSYIKICKKIITTDVSLPNWHTWYDMYNMANRLGIRVRPNKLNSNQEIRHLHDGLSNIINRDKVTIKKYKNSIFEEFIAPTKKYDGFEFIQIRTAQDLVDEGISMHHCVGSYADKCANGRSIIFSMRKDGKGYVTIELDTRNYKVSQQYTLHDITVTSQKALDIINRWDNDCIKLHKDDKETYYEICQRKVKAFLDRERSETLKELVKRGIADSESQILKNEYPHADKEIEYATAF